MLMYSGLDEIRQKNSPFLLAEQAVLGCETGRFRV